MHRRNTLQSLIIEQSGTQTLILNDLILGSEGTQLLSSLLPQYHPTLRHLQLKGNNIDSQGFSRIFKALLHCPHLTTLNCQWNSLGSSPQGLHSLTDLVSHCRTLSHIDLKNNRLTAATAQSLAQMIQLNSPSLTHLQLRFNQLQEAGGRALLDAIASNHHLQYLGVEDNRITPHLMHLIQQGITRRAFTNISNTVQRSNSNIYSGDAYLSMDQQWRSAQLRSKLQSQQRECELSCEKVQVEIQSTLNKMRVRSAQRHQLQVRMSALHNEHIHHVNCLREQERVVALTQERCASVQHNLNHELGVLSQRKAELSLRMQEESARGVQKDERELAQVNGLMEQKMEKLSRVYKSTLVQKRGVRNSLAELKEEVLAMRLMREGIWDRVVGSKGVQGVGEYEEAIATTEADNRALGKKTQYIGEELSGVVMRGLRREENLEKEIFGLQCAIKESHKGMTMVNIDIEANEVKNNLLMDEERRREVEVEAKRRYLEHVQGENMINQEVEKCKGEEYRRGDKIGDQNIELRIRDVENALRAQMTQNTMVRNQYEKIVNLLETAAKRTMQNIIFEQ